MNIEFLGPLDRVTGSCTWMHDASNGWNFLVDCGIQQGEGNPDIWNNGTDWPFDPAELKFVLLTHAHMDHCGLIPLLYQKGFKGKIICTHETAEIAKIMLADAVKLGAPYGNEDINSITWFEPRGKSLIGGNLHAVDKDLFINFYRTSHIIGAVAIGIYWGPVGTGEQKSIIFSGDIGTSLENEENLPIIRHMMHPREFDYAVIESTYGGKIRPIEELSPNFRWQQLTDICNHIVTQKSTTLLPSFSLGRIQDLLFDLHWVLNNEQAKYSDIELILDSPTANKLTPIILEAIERTDFLGKNLKKVRPMWLGKQIFRWFELDDTDPFQVDRAIDIIRICLGETPKFPELAKKFGNSIAKNWKSRVKVIKSHQERNAIELNRPRIIVASAGSCDGGAVTNWIPKVVLDENNILGLVGYAAPNSIASEFNSLKNIENCERKRHRGKIYIEYTNTEIPYREILCNISTVTGYSAHADQTGLLGWLFWTFKGESKITAPIIFIQHGDDHERLALKKAITNTAGNRNITVKSPSLTNSKFTL
ncbi:MBL fold metallo-hydrolase [Nitrincola iocasae]|uniref:MBL fold metallo-hydrolase n=1 Tax=Nitrincola iocasae TaxID=2614693 RepID=A0A5J6LBH6_9GAMM|nr:MBL fold metallo-hydrolase [Nitrincola iocasae]QEW05883.1 MBL fold metallo-hydrolase [Nitrincola iocasae]